MGMFQAQIGLSGQPIIVFKVIDPFYHVYGVIRRIDMAALRPLRMEATYY